MQEIPVSRGKNLSLTETQSGEKNPTKIKILFYLFLNFCWLYSNTWVQNALEHICHTGPGFSVEDCAAAGCWGYWESGLSSELETGKQTVTFIPCSKCHHESGINTGIPNFHNSLGVLYKCLCHERQKLTGLTSVLLLTDQGGSSPRDSQGGEHTSSPAKWPWQPFKLCSFPLCFHANSGEKSPDASLLLREPEKPVWSA